MKKGPHKMMLESSRYDKWDRGGGGGGGGARLSSGVAVSGGGGGGGRERDRERERERQARAHQMSHAHASEPDASSLFPAPVRVTGNRDRVSQQIQIKLGDYHLAQTLLDDPSKSIGICAEPPSPAPCPVSRRESEFKKPAHAPVPQNGRVHHRPYVYGKNDGVGSTSAPTHRPPPPRIPNGIQHQNSIDSSQPAIETILKEMKALPTALSAMAATPRKELDNKFIYNPYTNKVQENPQLVAKEIKAPPPKPNLDNRISNSRSSISPDVVGKDLGLSDSEEEATTRLHPRILSPIDSAGSTASGSESSPSDSESESSSAESRRSGSAGEPPPVRPPPAPPTAIAPAPAPAVAPAPPPQPTQRSSWSLSNFAPPAPASAAPVAHHHHQQSAYDSGKEVEHALADVKGKPSPISDLSDSDVSSSPEAVIAVSRGRRRRSVPAAKRQPASPPSSDDDHSPAPPRPSPRPSHSALTPTLQSAHRAHTTTSPRLPTSSISGVIPAPVKRGRPAKVRATEEQPKKRRGRPRKQIPSSPPPTLSSSPPSPASPTASGESDIEPAHAAHVHHAVDKKSFIFRKVFTPKKGDEGGGKGGKGGKGKGGKGKGQVTIVEVGAPESEVDDEHERRMRERSDERRKKNEEAISARLSPPAEAELHTRTKESKDKTSSGRKSKDRNSSEKLLKDRTSNERLSSEIIINERITNERLSNERISDVRLPNERISSDRLTNEKIANERISNERLLSERILNDRLTSERVPKEKMLATERIIDKPIERRPGDRFPIRAEADVGAGDRLSGRITEKLKETVPEPTSISERVSAAAECRPDPLAARLAAEASAAVAGTVGVQLQVRVPLGRLRSETVARLRSLLAHDVRMMRKRTSSVSSSGAEKRARTPADHQVEEVAPTNHERALSACPRDTESDLSGVTPIYYSYFERLPADALSDEERDHKYYLGEAKRLRAAAEREPEPLARVMLYLESVLCFVLTGRVLELELDTKRAFTVYRETIEYIKSIHSMPQRYRASPHSTFSKLDILSLRVQALLYLRMFKMYHRDVREYYKIVQEYQQKPACAESVSPLSPTPSPAGSVGSVGSAASASSGYCSLAHSVPAHAHHALLQLTKYYTFLYVAHELWEQADCLCRLRANQDLFISVDRRCGPLTLFSTFRHLVQYVRHAISLLKSAPRE